MIVCESHLSRAKFNQIIRKFYGETPSSSSNTDSESLSSGFLDTLMETTWSLIDKEVLRYNHNIIDDSYILRLRSDIPVSSTGNKEDIVLEPYLVGERVYITRPKGVFDEYFYFYSEVIEDFKVCIPFTDFESDLLKTLNITPSQLRSNGWGFIKAFELVCDAVGISLTLGLFFSFFKLKGEEK